MNRTVKWTLGFAVVIAVAAGVWVRFRSQQERSRAAREAARIEAFKAACKEAIDEFHQRFNDKKFDEIYENSGLREPSKRALWLDVMRQMRDGLGSFRNVRALKLHVSRSRPIFVKRLTYPISRKARPPNNFQFHQKTR
jgi:hypothetical protein